MIATTLRTRLTLSAPLLLAAACASCARLDTNSKVDVQPIEVKPIHITVDVNVRIDRQLDQFFAFEEEIPAPSTRPTTASVTTQKGTTP
jgi:hypothetical protein